MTNSTPQVEPDQPSAFRGTTAIKAERNEHEVRCGMCGGAVYVSEGVFLFAKEGMDAGLDNPFKCESCEQEYDQLSYEG